MSIGNNDLMVLDLLLAAQVELLDVENAIGRLAMLTGHLVLSVGTVAATIEL